MELVLLVVLIICLALWAFSMLPGRAASPYSGWLPWIAVVIIAFEVFGHGHIG